MKAKLLWLFLTASLLVYTKAADSECEDVTAGLNAVLSACLLGTRQCLEVAMLGSLGDLLCVAEGVSSYQTLVRCEGQTSADQTYATICGGPRCYELIPFNYGEEAYSACCGVNSTIPGSCSPECKEELEQLKDEVKCCVYSTPYLLYFSTCGEGITLETLYETCDVELPATCEHLFTFYDSLALAPKGTVPVIFGLLVLYTLLF